MKYQIVDWAYNKLWPDKYFDSYLEGWDFVIDNYEEEDYEEILVVPIHTKEEGG